ncbi:phosphate acyltransferase [Companilactobacillus paralimentarius DSM 13238 = JCM 10415]|uniref:Phosphate acyltransferase n=1 Tax=Companilactobacillus paralimentarius DSM 13238 = JCM 10415 TaxID=1122151 RepID=A0A0R1PQB7_9LACO|nr:phosphate acyltransferase PlsX [Companilactobacillus paralimentarius]KAE9565326.1 phosphate acyltransferase [Companilactobacillus paralimentarius]KRL31251.1 phosphate acyltransferase [Companilactobacillus paralimentarius DSM 13238 = JCM 10415]MDR4934299.1 phosphate acyltransferase PlsX [Companilactobacillus paralimentarius]QFR68545.1 phosphate acyltransferase PlsX [Companilactobacillus paralimentarius]
MKIAVDAMGGDNAPQVIVEGIEQARDEWDNLEFVLYGDQEKIKKYLKNDTRISIVHTDEEILGTDEPVRAIRSKKNASMVLAAKSVKDGENDALFSLGNTGALLAAGIFIVGRIKQVDRPALMPTLPVTNSSLGVNILDVGANAEAKPSYLQQWAVMGSIYARDVKKIDKPRIALLNNGTEYDKGDTLHKDAYQLLKNTEGINFIGNVESNNILAGVADVIVTDGFTGNAALKATEGTATILLSELKDALLNNGIFTKMGAAIVSPSLKGLKKMFDTSQAGGAVLLGLKSPVIKAHGAADAKTVFYTVKQINDMLQNDTINKANKYFEKMSTEK